MRSYYIEALEHGSKLSIKIASVAVSAVHAVRPLVRGGEAVIAATFGLVHGLAFAGILRDLGLQGRTSVLALLGFNVGIELAQLVVVAAVVPLLIQAARRPWFDRARVGGAAVVLVVSGAWILDRLGWASDPFAAAEAWAVDHLWWGLGLSLALAVGAAVADRASSDRLAGTLVNGGGPN